MIHKEKIYCDFLSSFEWLNTSVTPTWSVYRKSNGIFFHIFPKFLTNILFKTIFIMSALSAKIQKKETVWKYIPCKYTVYIIKVLLELQLTLQISWNLSIIFKARTRQAFFSFLFFRSLAILFLKWKSKTCTLHRGNNWNAYNKATYVS